LKYRDGVSVLIRWRRRIAEIKTADIADKITKQLDNCYDGHKTNKPFCIKHDSHEHTVPHALLLLMETAFCLGEYAMDVNMDVNMKTGVVASRR
jgi:hypothetical protein